MVKLGERGTLEEHDDTQGPNTGKPGVDECKKAGSFQPGGTKDASIRKEARGEPGRKGPQWHRCNGDKGTRRMDKNQPSGRKDFITEDYKRKSYPTEDYRKETLTTEDYRR